MKKNVEELKKERGFIMAQGSNDNKGLVEACKKLRRVLEKIDYRRMLDEKRKRLHHDKKSS